MLYLARFALALSVSAVLVGCVRSTSVQLSPDVASRISATRAYIVIAQEEIDSEVARSGTGETLGLVGALVDASIESKRANKASLVMEPVRKALADFDFRKEFEKKFQASLSDLPRLKISQMEVIGEPYSVETHNRLRKEMSQDSLLVMAVDYHLSADFRCLVVYTRATLFQGNQEEGLYIGNFRYISAPVSSRSGDTSLKAWSGENARLLRMALHEGMNETIRMLKLDFVPKPEDQPTRNASLGPDGKLKVITILQPRGIYKGGVTTNSLNNMALEILSKDGDRIIFRSERTDRFTEEGHIHSSTTRTSFVPK